MEAKALFIASSRNSFQLSREFCQTCIFTSIFFRTPSAQSRHRVAAEVTRLKFLKKENKKSEPPHVGCYFLDRPLVEFSRRVRMGNRALGHNPGKTLVWNGTSGTGDVKGQKKGGAWYTHGLFNTNPRRPLPREGQLTSASLLPGPLPGKHWPVLTRLVSSRCVRCRSLIQSRLAFPLALRRKNRCGSAGMPLRAGVPSRGADAAQFHRSDLR